MNYAGQLLEALAQSVERACYGLERIGLVFSAGVDSTLVGVLASRLMEVYAVNVGLSGSHDASHAMDTEEELPFSVEYVEIDEEMVEHALARIVSALGEPNPLKVAVAVPFYFATRRAADEGVNVMLCGQGADELFGGYNRYLQALSDGGYEQLSAELENDVAKMWESQLRFDTAVAESNGVELRFPFLDEEFKNLALSVPAQEKLKKVNDASEYECTDEIDGGFYVRKHILRKVAEKASLPERIISRRKKAAQYGSGSEKLIKHIAKKNGFGGRDIMKDYVKSLL